MNEHAITVYSTPTCPYCKMAKEYFKEHSIEYTDVDVAADEEKAKEMIELSGQMGVPVLVVPAAMSSTGGAEVIVGFDRTALEEVLNSNE